jgi:excisionase family DNA binding protein
MQRHFTTGEVAKILDISAAMVRKLVDDGRLAGHRLPGTRYRRISREALLDFARQHPELCDPAKLDELMH